VKFLTHPGLVRPPPDHVAIFESGLHDRLAGDHPETVLGEFEVANDRRPEHAGDVGRRRRAASRCGVRIDLFGDRTAADEAAPFEDEHTPPRPCEVGGCRQAIVTGADDNHVVLHTAVRGG
jgi:hypothetical protein